MKPFTTLISTKKLNRILDHSDLRIFDCRFNLSDKGLGRFNYQINHIPGAIYAHLDDDLSGPIDPGKTGRHPLPDPSQFISQLGDWGISNDSQVIVYDDKTGGIAARMWFMLKWLGHDAVAVLEGGFERWQRKGMPLSKEVPKYEKSIFKANTNENRIKDVAWVNANRTNSEYKVIDSRAAERYQGKNEHIDPVAGHIPGAVNYPFADNLTGKGNFKSKKKLRKRFKELSKFPKSNLVFYCGSGVTACHNALAFEHAGCGEGSIYPGSWSHWITDKLRPIATEL